MNVTIRPLEVKHSTLPLVKRKGVETVGKHDPTRDGDVHPDTAKQLNPKEFEKFGQPPTSDDDPPTGDDDEDN